MKKVIYSVVLIAIFSVSCKKSEVNNSSDNGNGNGNGNCIGNGNNPEQQYNTFTPGTNWTYNTHDTITSMDTLYKVISTTSCSTFSNKNYHIFTSQIIDPAPTSPKTDSLYYFISQNDYYQFAKVIDLLPGINFNYLKTDKLPGQYWDTLLNVSIPYNGISISLKATIKNTVTAKNVTMTINNINYDSVIVVKTEFTNVSASAINGLVSIPIVTTQDIQTMYAPRHGMIKTILKYYFKATPPPGLNIPNLELSSGKITTLQASSIP